MVRLVLDWYVPVGQGKEALQYLPRQGAHVCAGSCSLRLWSNKKPAVLLLPSTLTLTSPEGAVNTPDRKVGCCCSVPPQMLGTYISWLHSPGVKTFPGFHATVRLCVPHALLLLAYSTPREYTLPVVTNALVSRLVTLATCMWHRRSVLFRLHCPAPSEFCAYHPLLIMAVRSCVTDCVNPCCCHWNPKGRLLRCPYQVLFAPSGHDTHGNPYSPPTRV